MVFLGRLLWSISVFIVLLVPIAHTEYIRLRKCRGAACPYTGSWLAHSDSLQRVLYNIHYIKMEEATFTITRGIPNIYQVDDFSMYFVNHLSQFEHESQKAYGYDVAMNLTHEFSIAAANGECNSLNISTRQSLMAFIPFFGGLPPNTTTSHTVKSIGQGNSLARIDSKALQCMATTCSLLKFTSRVVIGVAREEDYTIITDMVTILLQVCSFC